MQPYGEVVETTVRVASWNVWGQFGPWEDREPVIASTLRDVDADIICLQEAWQVGDELQVDRLGDALGYEHRVHHGEQEYLGLVSGQAVLSRWPIEMSTSLELDPFDDEGSGGGAAFARIAGPRGTIDVISLILEWRLDLSHVRAQQLKQLLTWAHELSGPLHPFHPLILCGDFNSVPESDELRAMVGLSPVHVPKMVFYDALAMRATGDRSTWTERNPFSEIGLYGNKQLDQIYSHWPKAHGAGHPVAAAVIGDEPIDGMYGSDHFGVMADLRY